MLIYGEIANHEWKKRAGVFLLSMVFALAAAGPAWAHRVTVFAWVENETVYTESKFSGGKRVKGGQIVVYDPGGTPLLTGKTNDQGEFAFKVPQRTPLKIVLQAGMGHRGEWTIPAEEIEAVPPNQRAALQPQEPTETASVKPSAPVSISSPSGCGPQDIQLAVEKALDKKLKPILKMLAESRDKGPTATDIFSGIGYIFGLVGAGAYFHYRRKKD